MRAVNIRATVSGFFGAGASCFAKVALDPNSKVSTWAKEQCFALQQRHINIAVNGNNACEAAGMISRGVFLLGMIAMNLAMVATFFEGMLESGSTIATALATGANFTLSAILGVLLFNESVNQTWMFGFGMTLTGVWILSSINVKK